MTPRAPDEAAKVAAIASQPIGEPFETLLGGFRPPADIDDWSVVATQHAQGSLVLFFRSLLMLGLRPERIHLIAKGYSASDAVIDWVQRQGICVQLLSRFDARRSYERASEHAISAHLSNALGSPRVLLIDEGGRIIRLATQVGSAAGKIRAVEQTTRGRTLVKACQPSFPVVDVASSYLKRDVESIDIALSMVDGLEHCLARAHLPPLEKSDAVLVGCGAVGRATAQHLAGRVGSLRLFDQNTGAALDVGRQLSCEVLQELTPRQLSGRLILGATGTRALPAKLVNRLLGGEVLANCASSDTEFPAYKWRDVGDGYCGSAWTRTYALQNDRGGSSKLLFGGFPVNFSTHRLDTVPLERFRLTRGLMLWGVMQALAASGSGLKSLRRNAILDSFARQETYSASL